MLRDLSNCPANFAFDLLRFQIRSLDLDDKRATANLAPGRRGRVGRRLNRECFRFAGKRNRHFDEGTRNMERTASVSDEAHRILADVNLSLPLICNDLVLMELRNIDPELLFEKVTKVIYRRIEKSISIDGVDLR